MISHEHSNYWNAVALHWFLCLIWLLVNFMHFFICIISPETFRENSIRCLNPTNYWSRTETNCFIKPNFMCSRESYTFLRPTVKRISSTSSHCLSLPWPVTPFIVFCNLLSVLNPKLTGVWKNWLGTLQKHHHFKVSHKLTTVLFLFQNIQRDFHTAIFPSELLWESHKKRRIHISIVK